MALESRILIIGSGVTGLQTAKTLLDDGFTNVHLTTLADRVGGVWASGPHGGVYPGLLTNSGHGNFELGSLEMPKIDLDKTEGRIKAETVTTYLEDFFEKFLKGRLDIRFGQKVIHLDRPASSSTGWLVRTRDVATGEEREEAWDRVVLCQGPHSTPRHVESLEPARFNGFIVHSSQLHAEIDARILAVPDETRIVVIGGGKSSIDLAARYASLGKKVTIVFREPKIFAGPSEYGDYLIKTRIISTLFPSQHLETWFDVLLHKTFIGAWYIRRRLEAGDKGRDAVLKISAESPLKRKDDGPIWRGPDASGGRSSTGPASFHYLVKDGKIDVVSGTQPIGLGEDGTSILLQDGSTLEAGVIIEGTGFKSSFDFIPLETRIKLGIEPVEPKQPISRSNDPLRGYSLLKNPPASPNAQPVSRVYKGILPVEAFETRDIVLNGFSLLLGAPYTAEITSHWISSFFQRDAFLKLPASKQEAYDYADAHANWIRARYPTVPIPWETNKWIPVANAQHFNDGLLRDLQLDPFRQEKGWFGLGWYTGLVESRHIRYLSDERQALRTEENKKNAKLVEKESGTPDSSSTLGSLAGAVSKWVWRRGARMQ